MIVEGCLHVSPSGHASAHAPWMSCEELDDALGSDIAERIMTTFDIENAADLERWLTGPPE